MVDGDSRRSMARRALGMERLLCCSMNVQDRTASSSRVRSIIHVMRNDEVAIPSMA